MTIQVVDPLFIMIRAAGALLSLAIGGCAINPTTGRSGAHYYIGLVRVDIPEQAGPLVMVDTTVLGLGFDGAAFLGWRQGSFVYAQPEDCRLIIVVRDARERPQVETLVRSLGEDACIAGPSPPSPPSPSPPQP